MEDNLKDNAIVILKFIGNNLLIFFIACAAAWFGVYQGIERSNQNVEEQDIETAIQYLQSASEEIAYQSKVLDNITGNLENVNYKSATDLARLESVLYYFDFAGIVLPYPMFSEKVIDDHRVRSRLSPTGINSIYRVLEQLKQEKNYILGEETREQEYMVATKNYPPNLNAEQAALVVDISVRKNTILLYKKHLNVLSGLLQTEIKYIQGVLTADEIRVIDRKQEKERLTAGKEEIDLNFKRIEQKNETEVIE